MSDAKPAVVMPFPFELAPLLVLPIRLQVHIHIPAHANAHAHAHVHVRVIGSGHIRRNKSSYGAIFIISEDELSWLLTWDLQLTSSLARLNLIIRGNRIAWHHKFLAFVSN